MKNSFKPLILIFSLTFLQQVFADDVLRLVTTTSTQNSGLSDYLIKQFTAQSGIEVHAVAVGTGKALAIARNGDADVILVHSQQDELEFIEQGFGIERHSLMYNDFLIVGPSVFSEATSVQDVLTKIKRTNSLFLSRGDDSGTHKKELALWKASAITPDDQWYRESGQGMGKTLHIASELQAYALTDRGTWLAQNANQKLDLQIAYQGAEELFNPYGVIAVNPQRHTHVNIDAANKLIDWLKSETGQNLIAQFTVDGKQLFFPNVN